MLKSGRPAVPWSGVPSPPGEAMHRMSRATLVQPKPLFVLVALAGLLPAAAGAARPAARGAGAPVPAAAASAPWEGTAFTADAGAVARAAARIDSDGDDVVVLLVGGGGGV